MVENTQKMNQSFKHYTELPTELQLMIVNEMKIDEKGRLSGCSRFCSKLARVSKNYIHGLRFYVWSEKKVVISVRHSVETIDTYFHGYDVAFVRESEATYMICSIPHVKELWREEVDRSTDLVQLAKEYFEKKFQLYKQFIISLIIFGSNINDFDIENMNNLQKLELSDVVDVLKFSKMRRLMKELCYKSNDDRILTDCEQIYQIENCFEAKDIRLNYTQFLKFSAKVLVLHIGELTENDVFIFITSWQNGTIRKHFELCCWDLNGSNFKIEELLRLLQIENNQSLIRQKFLIKHNMESAKVAKLGVYDSGVCAYMHFDVANRIVF